MIFAALPDLHLQSDRNLNTIVKLLSALPTTTHISIPSIPVTNRYLLLLPNLTDFPNFLNNNQTNDLFFP